MDYRKFVRKPASFSDTLTFENPYSGRSELSIDNFRFSTGWNSEYLVIEK